MKVAVCISGRCESRNRNTSLERNATRLREKFPAYDFYYATWTDFRDEFEKAFPGESCFFFREPELNGHPYELPEHAWASKRFQETRDFIVKGGEAFWEWSKHHTKQHLIHAMVCREIANQKYDVIVRTRFDVWIHHSAELEELVFDTFENQRVNAMAATKKTRFNEIVQFDTSPSGAHGEWLLDQLIIHPAGFIDPEQVFDLHSANLLNPAEMGWYQVLCKGSQTQHRSFDGLVNHDRNVLTKFFYKDIFELCRLRPISFFSILREECVQWIYRCRQYISATILSRYIPLRDIWRQTK